MTSERGEGPPRENMTRVVIVGGGFAGINAAKVLGGARGVDVTLIDRRNHHLFQPLLYQVAMAGLSPAEISAPIRSMLSRYPNIRVVLGAAQSIDLLRKMVTADIGELPFDYLILGCGATHSYFGHDEWEDYAPGLKTLEQATEIRRRVLTAFEDAERSSDPDEQTRLMTFAIVGGGPTGVELAGAIAEMSRLTLAKDFRSINARSARVLLLEAGPRILSMFSEAQAARASQDLADLGVDVRLRSTVTNIDAAGVQLGEEQIRAATVLWAAGVKASPLGARTGLEVDPQGRIIVEPDLTIKGHPHVFVTGDQARFTHQTGKPLPGTAPVAMQAGRYAARTILDDLRGRSRQPFHFVDKGQMATIGRSRAILEIGSVRMGGFPAWLLWLVIHIYYLTGFEKRLLVVTEWAWSYLTFGRGARLITAPDWHTKD
jgi:NADH:ubiquinone reductase (H+-translocating)